MSQGAIIRRLRLSFQTGRSIGSLLMKARGMKAAWHLAASDGALSAAEIVALYGKRWIIEPSFRDTKDLRFGMGMSELRIDDPQRISGSRLPSWIELGFVLNNFIGDAGFLLSSHQSVIEGDSRRGDVARISTCALAICGNTP